MLRVRSGNPRGFLFPPYSALTRDRIVKGNSSGFSRPVRPWNNGRICALHGPPVPEGSISAACGVMQHWLTNSGRRFTVYPFEALEFHSVKRSSVNESESRLETNGFVPF